MDILQFSDLVFSKLISCVLYKNTLYYFSGHFKVIHIGCQLIFCFYFVYYWVEFIFEFIVSVTEFFHNLLFYNRKH